jgi:UDP-N-acetylglucosamine 2-epimerase
MMRILPIFGTRPEVVKMAPVIQALKATPGCETVVCVTAQHREMLDQALKLFAIVPDVDLNLMKPNQTLAQLTAAIFDNLDPVLDKVQPDWVLVQGDTTTVMVAALASYYRKVRVGHVEAGLRTGDKWQPFPEEINRRMASVITDLHFAPTEHSRQNLLREGVDDWRIVVTGNPVIDALNEIARRPAPAEVEAMLKQWGVLDGDRQLVLVTAHRRENFGKPLEDIFAALLALAREHADRLQLVYPVHLNPHVHQLAHQVLGNVSNITLLPPLEYLPMVHLMRRAHLVLTDSGGIQEEATALGIPTLVMRQVTERPEGVEAGVLKLVGTDTQRIIDETNLLLKNSDAYHAMTTAQNPFGDGQAAGRIVRALLDFADREQTTHA